jgi:hypothetical protein
MSRTALAQNLKRAFASITLLCLCSAVLAAPEKPSAPAERLYSVAEFNRLGAGVYWVEAYFVTWPGNPDHPPCNLYARCIDTVLVSDAPGERLCADEKVCVLADTLPTGRGIYRISRAWKWETRWGKTDSGDAFRFLMGSVDAFRRLYQEQESLLDKRLRLRIRVSVYNTNPRSGSYAFLEDFCAGADCEKPQGKGN